MRKIERQMNAAIINRKSWAGGNTTVRIVDGLSWDCEVFLHGHHIADVNSSTKELTVNKDTLRRWPTVTTKSRLRALGANVYTKNRVTYLDGVAI